MALAKGSASVAVEVKKALNKRVVDLYRQFCRDTPRIIVMYNLEQTVAEVRHLLLLQFRKQGHAQDPRMIELLLQRGRMEHEETINQWKQKPHIMGILQPELAAPDVWLDREEFIRRFNANTLTDDDVWAGYDHRKMKERVAKLRAQVAASGGRSNQAIIDKLATLQ